MEFNLIPNKKEEYEPFFFGDQDISLLNIQSIKVSKPLVLVIVVFAWATFPPGEDKIVEFCSVDIASS